MERGYAAPADGSSPGARTARRYPGPVLRAALHALLHVAVPGLVARLGWRERWRSAWLVMVLANLVDLDHLLADPIYDPDRCSLGFHPLHSWFVQPLWIALAVWRPTRVLGVGLVVHMVLDGIDCALMG